MVKHCKSEGHCLEISVQSLLLKSFFFVLIDKNYVTYNTDQKFGNEKI